MLSRKDSNLNSLDQNQMCCHYTTGQFNTTNMSKNIKTKNPELLVRGFLFHSFSFSPKSYNFRTNIMYTRIPAISKLRLADNDHVFISSHCFLIYNYHKINKSFLIVNFF